MTGEKSRIEEIIDKINSKNAKKVALLLVVGFAFYHAVLHIKFGTNSCSWLLSDGRYKADQEWQPYGCMLHFYTKIDTRRCLRYIGYYGSESHFIFMGDTRISELYTTFVEEITQDENNGLKTINFTHVDQKLKIKVEFIWVPTISKMMIEKFRELQLFSKPPSVIIVGSALWPIVMSNGSLSMIEEYQRNLSGLVQPINKLNEKKTRTIWALQEPVDQEKLKPEYHMVTNEQIDLYNKAAIEVLSQSAAHLWWSKRLVGQGMVTESPDGIHLAKKALKHDTQILLNMYCNDYMNFNDGTCCSSVETRTTLQIVTFAILACCNCGFNDHTQSLYALSRKTSI
ncbi:hypothetical protein NQ317_006732 [Molorchus minor]|uniref:CAS1 domain-containing protein 1 n=1 Tax=Molorchus minor TaxID=1323400 RepID=A0ABQ9ISB8_9CUCU|nr:hypothetical protein NQ317_006732 [Molorchus minor]